MPDSLSVLFQAPYVLGPSMLQAVIAKDDEKGVDALFEDPPFADASFVTPSTLLDHRTFQTVEPPALQQGEKRAGKPDVFGSLSLFQVLASRLDNADRAQCGRRLGRRLDPHVHDARGRPACARRSRARAPTASAP